MSAPLPDALRARFQELIAEGLSGRAAALRLKRSPATGALWGLAIRHTGHARSAPQGRPRDNGKRDPHRAFFAEIIAQDGDMTMPELAAALHDAPGVRAHPNAIGKFLHKLGYTQKKVAGCRRAPSIQGKTAARRPVQVSYSGGVSTARAYCLYCFSGHCCAMPCQPADETSVKTNLTRLRGWALRGDRLIIGAPFRAVVMPPMP